MEPEYKVLKTDSYVGERWSEKPDIPDYECADWERHSWLGTDVVTTIWLYEKKEPTLLETVKSAIEYLKSHFNIENVTCLKNMKDAIAREEEK